MSRHAAESDQGPGAFCGGTSFAGITETLPARASGESRDRNR